MQVGEPQVIVERDVVVQKTEFKYMGINNPESWGD